MADAHVMEITKEDLENLRARDERWQAIDLSLKIDAELQSSLLINLVIEAAARRAERAKESLVDANPADIKEIIALQAEAQCARIIGETLRNIKNSASNAYQAVKDDEESQRAGIL